MSALIAHDLSIALLETVKLHAETHDGGKMDLVRTLSAIRDIASGLLAELPSPDRGEHCRALIFGIVNDMSRKVEQQQQRDECRTRQ